MRLPDDAVTVGSGGSVLTVDAQNVAVVDARAVPAGETAATVSFQMRWKGGGRLHHVVGNSPAFAAGLYRRARVRGTFAGAEDGFSFTSDARARVRTTFAELGNEQNGLFLGAATSCDRCGQPWSAP